MLGRLKKIANTEITRSEDQEYFFCKVQLPHGAEEYWLLTDGDLKQVGTVDVRLRRGHLVLIEKGQNGLMLDMPNGDVLVLVLSDDRLERIRARVDRNQEDVELHLESWLADLFD
jgi:hypothetical protein